MKLPRRQFLHLAVGAAALSAVSRTAGAQTYPARPIRLVVPFPPGGAVDPVARLIANPLAARLGQPVVVYNRGGAGGSLGMEEVAKSAPDGYTLLLAHSGLNYMPALYRKLSFDPVRDFDGVIVAVSNCFVLAVNPDVPVKSVAELIAYAKANPGKLTYGSAGIGSVIHLAGEYFKHAAGVNILHVPYKGAGPAVTDLLGGQIQMMFGAEVSILPLVQAGKIRALAVTSAQRSALAPELPTVAETLRGFEILTWNGLAAPAGTPKDVIARLNAETNRVLQSPDLSAQMRQLGFEPIGGTPDEASARIKSDVVPWKKIIEDSGIQPQ